MGKHKETKKVEAMDKRHEEAQKETVAFTMERNEKREWFFIVLTLKGDKVVSREVKKCDDKRHAIESYEIAFVNQFIYGQ